MMKSIKRMVLTGVAVTVTMLSFTAPAMALPPGQVAPPDPPGQVAPADPTPDDPNPGDPTPGDPNPPGDTNEGGGSNAGSSDDSGGYGNTGTVGGTFDRGGVFISGLLPNSFTSMLGDVGNSVKDNLPAAIAKNVPNTDGGWSLLALVVASLATGGLVLRSAAKRISRATRTAQ